MAFLMNLELFFYIAESSSVLIIKLCCTIGICGPKPLNYKYVRIN